MHGKTKKKHVGLIAQELERVLPEAVATDEYTGFLSVAYGNLVALLIQGLKEQDAQLEKQKNKLKTRDVDIQNMGRRLSLLENEIFS